jgi:hypothetical protein
MYRKKIYISGKITGDDNYRVKFLKAKDRLFEAGYFPFNPAVLEEMQWKKAMRVVVKAMLDCEGVALLPDWKDSRGAKIEARLSREVGIPVKPIEDWIAEGGK